jgi:DNA-binding response OmpR family regulator
MPADASESSTRILIVDDDEDARLALLGLLEEARLLGTSGSVVDEAASLAEAVAGLRRERYDVVVLDARLRDGSATDLIPHLRRIQETAKIVLYTGDVDAARNSGADLVIVKGSDPADFLPRIRLLLRRPC